MQHFVGTFECKADDKGRIMLPMSLKKQLSDKLKNSFVIKRAVFNQCLELYPIKEWDSLMERINNLNRFNKKNIDFIRRFTAGVRQIDIDISGRILIPKDLINHAKIKKESESDFNINKSRELVTYSNMLITKKSTNWF